MRLTLTFIVVLVICAATVGIFEVYAVPAMDECTGCGTQAATSGCDRTANPMPCCEIRSMPPSTSSLPPSSARVDAPARVHLQLNNHTFPGAILHPNWTASIHLNALHSLQDPPKLFRLHSAYLI